MRKTSGCRTSFLKLVLLVELVRLGTRSLRSTELIKGFLKNTTS